MKQDINLLAYENNLIKYGHHLIAGMDEAGRGPLAGPVTACCCIPNLTQIIDGINDSKQLSVKKRELYFNELINTSIGYSIVDVECDEIDEINILNATKKAMHNAVLSILPVPEIVLVDAVKYDFGIDSISLIHGDTLSYSIASASIIAKVHRDALMMKYATVYPEYGFEKHKGYGTKLHIDMLKKYGPCPIHRKTFIKKFID